MAVFGAEYLYIIQPCSAVESNRNLFKFGKTTNDPLKKRLTGYEKGCRIWLIIIMNNVHEAERNLLQLFRTKYISRTEKGDEYFEVENIEDMINDVMTYRAENFVNYYLPANGDEMDSVRCFLDSRNKIVRSDGNVKYILSCDIGCCDFAYWLESKGWKYDSKSHRCWLSNEEYDAFVDSLHVKVEDEINDEENNKQPIDEPQQPANNNTTQPQQQMKTSQQPQQQPQMKLSLQQLSPPPSQPQQQMKTVTTSSQMPQLSALPPLTPSRAHTTRLTPLSIEKLHTVIEPCIKQHNTSAHNISCSILISLTNKQNLLSIKHIKLYNRNELIVDTDNLSTIYTGQTIFDLSTIQLTPSKLEKLNLVKTNGINDYILFIPSFEMKRWRPKGRKQYVKFLMCEFIPAEGNNEFTTNLNHDVNTQAD